MDWEERKGDWEREWGRDTTAILIQHRKDHISHLLPQQSSICEKTSPNSVALSNRLCSHVHEHSCQLWFRCSITRSPSVDCEYIKVCSRIWTVFWSISMCTLFLGSAGRIDMHFSWTITNTKDSRLIGRKDYSAHTVEENIFWPITQILIQAKSSHSLWSLSTTEQTQILIMSGLFFLAGDLPWSSC